ncbi:hypothetical protein [Persephonella sp.]
MCLNVIWEKLEDKILELERKKEKEGKIHYQCLEEFLRRIDPNLNFERNFKRRKDCTNRNRKYRPDIILKKTYAQKDLYFLLEFKRICNGEFNITLLSENKLYLCSDGILSNWEDFIRGGKSNYPNKDRDGIGQIKGYVLCSDYGDNEVYGIITNGFLWVIFNYNNSTNYDDIARKSVEEDNIIYFKLPEDIEAFRCFFLEVNGDGLHNWRSLRKRMMKNKLIVINHEEEEIS